MYEFARGPLVWIALLVFAGGCLYRLVWMVRAAKQDKVVIPYMSWKYGLRSLLHWIVPFASRNMRLHPVMTVVTFVFHICLLLTPIFLLAHNVLWQQSWGVSWWSLPSRLADVMTVAVMAGGIFFIGRRLRLPEVRNVTDYSDYLLIAVVLAPFVTGFIASQQWFAYRTMVILHMWTGALMLMAIPFTRLSHMLYFIFTRMYMGSEFGAVRNAKDW
ncbi:MAG: nitrate reductase [Candidatus Abyssobacteria bacterium SURF_17]|uniref:Nitrate reductase n=1 Tax=Candidatus Abyssobacteria bacterium SURF_17 TaxID=2093361 RepID=A0A419EPV0_9BACT|nr:MAG: nitrate reductase [Candidatus Abyssubacteria bacterium SURF_17]